MANVFSSRCRHQGMSRLPSRSFSTGRLDSNGECDATIRTSEADRSTMNTNDGLPLVAPRVMPVLDPGFRPAVLAVRAFHSLVESTSGAVPVRLALEQADGSVFRFDTHLLPESHPQASANVPFLERLVKFLLWSRGGWRIYVDGPESSANSLAAHYRQTPTGRFDANFVAERIFDHPLEVVHTRDLPPELSKTKPLGRHLEGCR